MVYQPDAAVSGYKMLPAGDAKYRFTKAGVLSAGVSEPMARLGDHPAGRTRMVCMMLLVVVVTTKGIHR